MVSVGSRRFAGESWWPLAGAPSASTPVSCLVLLTPSVDRPPVSHSGRSPRPISQPPSCPVMPQPPRPAARSPLTAQFRSAVAGGRCAEVPRTRCGSGPSRPADPPWSPHAGCYGADLVGDAVVLQSAPVLDRQVAEPLLEPLRRTGWSANRSCALFQPSAYRPRASACSGLMSSASWRSSRSRSSRSAARRLPSASIVRAHSGPKRSLRRRRTTNHATRAQINNTTTTTGTMIATRAPVDIGARCPPRGAPSGRVPWPAFLSTASFLLLPCDRTPSPPLSLTVLRTKRECRAGCPSPDIERGAAVMSLARPL